jgi:hypothetical protein
MATIIDSYSEENQDGSGIISNTVGQSFTNNSGSIQLDSCKFYLKKGGISGSPTGNAVAKIYAHSGTYGTSSVPTGSALATSDNFDVSTLSGSFGLATFNFSGSNRIQLNDSTYYCVLIEYTNGDEFDYVENGHDESSPSHSGNQFYGSEGDWTAQNAVDVCFYVYGDTDFSFSSSSSSFSSSSFSSSSSSFSSSSLSSSSISSISFSSSSSFAPGLYENYNTGNDNYYSAGQDYFAAQSFTAESTHMVSSVKLLISRNGTNIGTVYAKIYATNVDGEPTGDALCSSSTNGNDLPSWYVNPEWIEFTFDNTINIVNETKYAIVLSAPNTGGGDFVSWEIDNSSPTYTGGNLLYSFDSGDTWSNETSADCMFEVWGGTSSSSSFSSSSYSSESSSLSSSSHSSSFSSSSSTQTFEYQEIFYPDADPETTSIDGYAGRIGVDETFANIRTGSGNTSDDSGDNILVYLKASTTEDQFEELKRGILLFDTSSLPDDCTITSAVLSIYGSAASSGLGSSDLHIGSALPENNINLSDEDYGTCGTTSFGNISFASWGSGYKNITFNSSGRSAISKTGISKFSAQLSWDIENSFDGSWVSGTQSGFTFYSADKGTSYRPYLTVNYTTTSSSSSSSFSSSSSSSSSFSSCSSSFSSSSFSSCSSSFSSCSSSFSSSSESSISSCSSSFSSCSSSFSSSSSCSSSFSSSSFSSSSESFSSSSSSFSSSSHSSSSFSSHSITPERKIVVKLYDKDNVYQRVLSEALYDISIEKTLYHGSGSISITLDTKVDDLADDITLNSKIKISFRNKWNQDPVPVYYGYIVSIDPFIQSGEERTSITCLGAISKLKNDFLAQTGLYLAYEVENKQIDLHIKEILANYRNSINDTYGDYDPCMIDDPDNYWSNTNYIEETSTIGKIPYRYFTSKHIDAIQEISKFLPKNQTGGEYYYYYLNDTDSSSNKARFILKKLSTTADHRLQINKHITSLSMRKNIEELVNTVYFWNEEGTSKDKVLMTAKDETSQQTYDKIADRITDSKVSTYTQADLFSQARLKEAKDEKAEITITVSDINYDILSFKLGDVINIRDTKKGTDLYPDNVLIIQKIILTPREAILELSKPRPDLSTQVESDREYIDRQLTWFGNIITRVDASNLTPGALHWITDDIIFDSDSDTQISWNGGTFKLPNDVHRVIAEGNTGSMSEDTYLYVDEKNVWCGKDTGLSAEVSGTGSVKVGENILVDSTKSWQKDQWKGYALWINPDGGSTEKHIISQNYSTQLMVEGHDPFDTTDATCSYEIHKLVLRQTTQLNKTGVQADSGSTTTLVDNALTEANDFWNGYEIKFLSGDNIGLTRTITDFTASNDTLTFAALPYAIEAGVYYELYLSSETQILISTGIPTSEPTEKAEVIPKVSAVENSAYFNAQNHIVERSITADQIRANTITTNEINFTAANEDNIIATIHASTEDGGTLRINANKIKIDGTADFASGYDPTTKLATADAGNLAYYNLVRTAMEDETIIVGGYIETSLLTADNIVTGTLYANLVNIVNLNANNISTGTLTGRTIRSAASGNRMELVGSGYGNYITWWNTSDNLKAYIIATPEDGDMLINADSTLYLKSQTNAIIASGHVCPDANNTYYLGTDSLGWKGLNLVYGSDAYILQGGNLRFKFGSSGGNIECGRTFVPSSSASYDLGSSSYKWKNIYATGFIYTTGDVYSNYIYLEGGTIYRESGDTIFSAQTNAGGDYVQWGKHLDPWSSARYNLGGSVRYWNDISYKTLTDRGCLGVFDDGVELQNGEIVSDIEAIKSMKKDENLKTVYGVPRFDYKTMPKSVYRPAVDHKGNLLKRDENDKPYIVEKNKKIYAEDGAETTALISIMLGAIKELDKRLEGIEKNI